MANAGSSTAKLKTSGILPFPFRDPTYKAVECARNDNRSRNQRGRQQKRARKKKATSLSKAERVRARLSRAALTIAGNFFMGSIDQSISYDAE
jgi:hypothetical protein